MVLVFDLNGTLLNTQSLSPAIRSIFGSSYTARQWFQEMLLYAMATALAGDYRDISDIGADVLGMAAAARDVRLTAEDIARVKKAMREMPPFPDVPPGLKRLRDAGVRLAVLTNSGSAMLDEQLRNARLTEYFEEAVSVSLIRRYKPAMEPYGGVAEALQVDTQDIIMVASHAWDLMGASRAGCRTAFLARPEQALLPSQPRPDYTADTVTDLADQILGRKLATESAARYSVPEVLGAALTGGALLLGARRIRRQRSLQS